MWKFSNYQIPICTPLKILAKNSVTKKTTDAKNCKIIRKQKYKGNDQCKNKKKKSRDNPALTPLLSSLDSVASAGSTSAFSPAVSLSRWYCLCFYHHCLCLHLRHVSLAISLAFKVTSPIFFLFS